MAELRKKTEGATNPDADRREYVVGVELLRAKATAETREPTKMKPTKADTGQPRRKQKANRKTRQGARPEKTGPLAVVTSYRYFDDITVFSTVDLGTGQVVDVEAAQHLRTAALGRRIRGSQGPGARAERAGEGTLRAVRRRAHCLSPVQPVHRQGRSAGPSRGPPDLPGRQTET